MNQTHNEMTNSLVHGTAARRAVRALISVAFVGVAIFTAWQTFADGPTAPPKVLRAVCVIHPLESSGVEGTVTFKAKGDTVEIDAKLTGLTPGLHGFHIHEFGDCTSLDGGSAGGHFNPHNTPHAGPDAPRRHIGDLGNFNADKNGVAAYHRTDKVIQLNGPDSIIGRSVIIHANPDDLKTQPSGNAGARVACGIIGIAKPE